MLPLSLRSSSLLAGVVAIVTSVATCSRPSQRAESVDDGAAPAAVAAAPGEWRTLFDGTTADAWRGYQSTALPDGWRVVDGTLAKTSPTGDIITRDQFGDFELEFEWKIGRGGNAGVFYRATEEYERIYWSAPEYQLLDDPNTRDGRDRLTAAGAAYGLYPAPEGTVKPHDEWNISRIVVRGAHVEHWLNGQQLLAYELWSPEWEAKVKDTKFAAWPNFARARRGHIGIQGDHGGTLAFRSIRIREF